VDTLQISFFGPLLYRLQATQVQIYAPQCTDHIAGMFGANNEAPLIAQHRHGDKRCYRVGGRVFAPPNPLPLPWMYDPQNTILDATKYGKPSLDTAGFCLTVPQPQIICPLNPTKVQLIDDSGSIPLSWTPRATGLRFYYAADLTQNLTLSVDGSTAGSWQFAFDAKALKLDFDDVYVRFASTSEEDPEHNDAMECFDSVAALGGVNWWVSYDDPTKQLGSSLFVRGGNDCRAPILTTTL
jgi:hypothetical protein